MRCSGLCAAVAVAGSLATAALAQPAAWVVAWKGVEKHNYPEYTVTNAARELASGMEKVLGQKVEVIPWEQAQGKNILFLTEARYAPRDIQDRLVGKRRDAFVIKYPVELEGRTCCLLVTRDNFAHDFSAYWFLTRFMDFHWVGPGELGEVFTPRPDWQMPKAIDLLEEPHFEHRFWNMGSFGGRQWMGRSLRMSWHHSLFHVFDPAKYAKTDPEVYPMLADGTRYIPKPGEHGWQPCMSHPRSIEIATQSVLESLAKNPERISASLSLNDGAGNDCMCPACRALDEPDAITPGRRENFSDRYYTFCNSVMENVLKTSPEAYIAVLHYGVASQPPRRVKVNPRIQVFFGQVEPAVLCQWARCGVGVNLHLWLYDDGYLLIRPDMRGIADRLRMVHAMNGTGVYSEVIPHWPASGPRFYVFAHLLWDTSRKVEYLYREYFTLAYGPEAAPWVQQVFARWDEIFNRQPLDWQYNAMRTWRRATQFEHLRRDDFDFMDRALARAQAAGMTDRQRQRLQYLLTYHRWLRINAEQWLLSREMRDPEWAADKSFDEMAAVVEPSLALTGEFNRIWQEQIAADTTGWLMDRNTQRKADETWDNFVAQLRMLVTSAHETAVDAAFATVTQREKARGGDKAALAFWEGHLKNRPALAAFIAPQMDRLKAVEPPDVVANGGFERLAGDPPRPEGWLTYQDYGMMKATKNNYSWAPGTGRDGGRAFGLGDGAYAELRSVVKLEAGRRYALSLWYRTENREGQPASFTAFHVSGEIEDPATIETKRIDARFLWFDLEPTNGEWRRFTCAFTPSQGGSFILQPVGGRQKPGQWVWFDDVEIRKIW